MGDGVAVKEHGILVIPDPFIGENRRTKPSYGQQQAN
jgi:hypothetical protein